MPRFLLAAVLALLVSATLVSARLPLSDDEFVGPFPNWLNVKTDCGAVGDGKADDTAAIQKGLDALGIVNGPKKVLYFPAGTYRITATLRSLRPGTAHFVYMAVSIFGEDASTTIIKWDGPQDGVMWDYGPWFSELGRLTLDGAGRAKTALKHGPGFVTYNMIADMIIRDVAFGIEAGQVAGIAETAVMRCRFYRCSTAAVSVQNFNSLDWWVWDSLFEDCRIGVTTEFLAGNFNVYRCLFRRSTEADITIGHTHFYAFRENTSVDSKAFFVAKRPKNWADDENWSGQVTLERNRIYRPLDATPIRVGNAGSILLLDNVILSRPEVKRGPVALVATPSGDGDLVSLGNTFTVPDPLLAKGRLVTIDDVVVKPRAVRVVIPRLLAMRPNLHRPLFDIPAGANAATIQAALDAAAKLTGQRPVVHLSRGAYNIAQTLEIPAHSDLQLVGDGVESTTVLNWTGKTAQPLVHLAGPSRATLRNFCVTGNPGILLDNCDQPGSRIYLEQPWLDAKESGIIVDRVENAQVLLHAAQLGGNHDFAAMKIIGGARAAAGKPVTARVIIHNGVMLNNQCTYDVENGNLLVRDMWYEGSVERGLALCRGYGTFTLHGVLLAYDGKPLRFENYRGNASFVQTEWSDVKVNIAGNSKDARFLFLGLNNLYQSNTFLDGPAGDATVSLVNCRYRSTKELQGSVPLPNQGTQEASYLKAMLAHTRDTRLPVMTPVPTGASDVRFFRIFTGGTIGLHIRAEK